MIHGRREYDGAIQPWPTTRAHYARLGPDGPVGLFADTPEAEAAARPIIGVNEPVWLIRAQDEIGALALEAYIELAVTAGYDDELIGHARAHLALFEKWQADHRDEVKRADLPEGSTTPIEGSWAG